MARIILIHGAWGNASSWIRVTPLLAAKGHTVEAIDLPGHGRSPVSPDTVGQADYVDHLEQRLLDGPPALLVGHSMGGIVIAQAASRQPDHVTRCVYVAALLPRDGDSLLSLIRQQDAPGIQPAVLHGPLKGTTTLDPEIAGPILFQDAPEAEQRASLAQMSPQSNQAQRDPAVIADGFDRVPRAYVFCSEDRTVTYDLQKKMVAATPCDPCYTFDCGHMPQLTRAKDLAAIIDALT